MTMESNEKDQPLDPCQHGNRVPPGENKTTCACMVIDGMWHPCRGCHHTCGNCL